MTQATYNAAQTKQILQAIGIQIVSETDEDFTAMCCFHKNTYDAAMAISKTTGAYMCFNPSCGRSGGSLKSLVAAALKLNKFETLRVISSIASQKRDLGEEVAEILSVTEDFDTFDQNIVDQCQIALESNQRAIDYLTGKRGLKESTIREFGLGYSTKNDMVTVPVYSHTGQLVGMFARSIEGKSVKNSHGLPVSKIFFNLNNARKLSPTVIVTESCMDSMTVFQAGHPNVIGTLGGNVSIEKMNLLNIYFETVIIMTDTDGPGRKLGNKIADGFLREVFWADMPAGIKDANEMSEEQIKYAIKNCIPHYEYASKA